MSDALAHIRERLGMTQMEFAQALGLNQSTVSRWELRKQQPSVKAIRALRQLAREKRIKINDAALLGEQAA